MARAKVIHSEDAVTVVFKGDKSSPEPSTGVIKFPGGAVEVSRTSDGKYWAHVHVNNSAEIINSRLDFQDGVITRIADEPNLAQIAIKVDGVYEEY